MIAGRSKEETDYASLYKAKWGAGHWSHPSPAILLSRPRYDSHQANEQSVRGLGRKPRAARGVVFVDLPGDRVTSFSEPHVQVAAQRLTRCLELAKQTGSGTLPVDADEAFPIAFT